MLQIFSEIREGKEIIKKMLQIFGVPEKHNCKIITTLDG